MAPRYNDGELILVETSRPPVPGDHVMVLQSERAMVRRLVAIDSTSVTLESYAPRRKERRRRAAIKLLRVLDLSDIVGG